MSGIVLHCKHVNLMEPAKRCDRKLAQTANTMIILVLFLLQACNNNAKQLERQTHDVALCVPREVLCLKSLHSVALSAGIENTALDFRAEGFAHCPADQDLDESPARVEGTNKSEP